MEIRIIHFETDKAPVAGYAMYVVVLETAGKVHLLHPISFQEFWVTSEEYKLGLGAMLWPINNSGSSFDLRRFTDNLKNRMQSFVLRKKAFPANTLMKVVAVLTETSLREVEETLKAALPASVLTLNQRNRLTVEYRLAKKANLSSFRGRQRAVLNALEKLGTGSIHLIVDACKDSLKTKVGRERAVTYFMNQFVKQGIVEIVGEQFTITENNNE